MSNLYSQESEKAILGCFLLDINDSMELLIALDDTDFEVATHRLIMVAIKSLIKNNSPVDMVTVSEMIKTESQKETDSVFAYIGSLCNGDFIPSNAKQYFDIIKDKAAKRKAIYASHKFIESLKDSSEPFEKTYTDYDKQLAAISDTSVTKEYIVDWGPIMIERLSQLGEPEDLSGVIIDTTLPTVNKLTNMFRGGQLVVVAADTGVGKSTYVMQVCANELLHGTNEGGILCLSFEMKHKDMSSRLISVGAAVDMGHLSFNPDKLKDDDWARIVEFYGKIEGKDIAINNVYTARLNEIEIEVSRYIKKNGTPKIIVVDYISLIKADEKMNKVQQVCDITRYLKLLAAETGCLVLAVQQLNRASASRTGSDAMPRLSDLKDSSSVEQDADIVIFLHRKNRNSVQPDGPKEVVFYVAKSRNGQEGYVDAVHDGAKMIFKEVPTGLY